MPDLLLAPDLTIAEHLVPARINVAAVRRSEWVIVAFLVYAAVAALILPLAPAVRNRVVLLNWAVILSYVLLGFDSGRQALTLSVIRDWLPLALILLAYREMGWFALPHPDHALESHWVILDRMVLRGGAKAAIEVFGPVLPSILEIAYTLVYALAPFSLAVLYLYRRRDRVDRFLFIFAAGVLLCYAQFPFWPSDPPRMVFFGQDFPLYDTVFRRFNWWMLGGYGIHTSVFPSAHVAGAFAAAFGMRQALPRHKWVSRFLLVMALLIAVATVYGRYHYVADAVAGFSLAVFVLALERHKSAIAHTANRCFGDILSRRPTAAVCLAHSEVPRQPGRPLGQPPVWIAGSGRRSPFPPSAQPLPTGRSAPSHRPFSPFPPAARPLATGRSAPSHRPPDFG